jgi:hypothetical protein
MVKFVILKPQGETPARKENKFVHINLPVGTICEGDGIPMEHEEFGKNHRVSCNIDGVTYTHIDLYNEFTDYWKLQEGGRRKTNKTTKNVRKNRRRYSRRN